jgi:DNA-binding NtrC family response regulator
MRASVRIFAMTLKALVVDDEPSILVTLGLILKSEGFEVRTVSSGKAAKVVLAETTFDLVVTDLSLETQPKVTRLFAPPKSRRERLPRSSLVVSLICLTSGKPKERMRGFKSQPKCLSS